MLLLGNICYDFCKTALSICLIQVHWSVLTAKDTSPAAKSCHRL